MTTPAEALAGHEASDGTLAVACSGGADSTALLIAAQARWPGRVVGLHIHHGLQPAADGFVTHVQALCARLGVPLHVARIDARHPPGDSPEATARNARYAALAELAQACGAAEVLLAQHADDQAETLLLALSRGAGLPGLASMPARFERHGTRFTRPWLALPGAAIRDWLVAQGESWVEDPTNADTGYTRNRIRLQLLPALQAAFPHFRETFARSAGHVAQAQSLLDELALADLAAVGDPPAIAALRALSGDRQANLLRHWLKARHGVMPSSAQLEALQAQIAACATRGHRIHLKVGDGFAERRGGVLAWYNPKVLDGQMPHRGQ